MQKRVEIIFSRLYIENKEREVSSYAERQALRQLSTKGRQALEVLRRYEVDGMVSLPDLCRVLEDNPILFVAFSCLGTHRGKEELKLDLFETFFLRRFYEEARVLFDELNASGAATKLIIILPDKEPKRTWGWETPQEEITGWCQLLIEEKAKLLPYSWEVVLWSDIERDSGESYEKILRGTGEAVSSLWIKEEAEHLERFPEILTRSRKRDVAIRQIAAYMFEGSILERIFPRAILIQSEFPARRKDRMYLPLRKAALPIIHPFALE